MKNNFLKESYVFEDDYEGEDQNQEENGQDYEETNEETDLISEMRKLSLKGIEKYADNVDSDEYNFFKKVWLMADKVESDDNEDIDN